MHDYFENKSLNKNNVQKMNFELKNKSIWQF